MVTSAFRNLFWGFLLVLVDFRLAGFDILPDVVGYLFFYIAIRTLEEHSGFFSQAKVFTVAMIVISLVQLYEPSDSQSGASFLGNIGTFVAFVGFFISLLLMYRVFMGIGEMAGKQGYEHLALESRKRWKQFLFLKFALLIAIVLIFIPPLALLYILAVLVFNVVYAFLVLGFIRRCRDAFAILD